MKSVIRNLLDFLIHCSLWYPKLFLKFLLQEMHKIFTLFTLIKLQKKISYNESWKIATENLLASETQ